MKLSQRLRSHRWKTGSSASHADEWRFSADPIRAAELLDECEASLREILSYPDLVRPSATQESPFVRARMMLSKLNDRGVTPEIGLFYVRENNTLRKLPKDIDAAIEIIREEFVAGHTQGMLCRKDRDLNYVGEGLFAHGVENWADFESRARLWLSHSLDVVPGS
ncbi:hypothetical protein WOA01_00980 [Methylocystis sp. IM2]|uniref:hypothetical protein n=1 Tax=Methylocystis sp. IM2 TaxID=3136563 RepID=UPI0030F8A227